MPERARVPCYRSPVHYLATAGAALFFVTLASCGGSSSETPPPLEPLPANVKYSRAATTLPGELGTPVMPASSGTAEGPDEEPAGQGTPPPPAKPK